jgi:hypothetical protein
MVEDKVMAARWLSENVDLVLRDLGRLHNMHMDMAYMHCILKDERESLIERVESVVKILLENA